MRFLSFSSGSCGNCYLLLHEEEGCATSGVLIDAGVSIRRMKKVLESQALDLDCFQSVLVTHDHGDHIRNLGSICKRLSKPVYTTPILQDALQHHPFTRLEIAGCRRDLVTDAWNRVAEGIEVQYFEVPHDATQTVGFAIRCEGRLFVLMTDLGHVTEEALQWARQADTVVIESNYDPEMLRNGPYPPDLQKRISNGHGHLSNPECAEAIREFNHEGLSHIFLCHLSEHNNTPELAYRESLPFAGSASLAPLPRQTASPLIILRP